MSWCVQVRDLEEGNSAMWHEKPNTQRDTEHDARAIARELRRVAYESEALLLFRVTEVDSAQYYAQPTDVLEY